MVDRVNNAYDVLKALASTMRRTPELSTVPVKVMGLVNEDPNQAVKGWVGLYVDRSSYRPRALGAGMKSWTESPQFKVIVQASDAGSSEAAYAKLEELKGKVLDAIFADKTLGAYVDGSLLAIDVAYGAKEDDKVSLHFEGAVLTLTYESRTR